MEIEAGGVELQKVLNSLSFVQEGCGAPTSVPTRRRCSLMTHSCLAHWPSHFFLQRKAQMRASFINSMDASVDGHWC